MYELFVCTCVVMVYFGGGLLNSFLGVGPGAGATGLFSWEVKDTVLPDSGVIDILID